MFLVPSGSKKILKLPEASLLTKTGLGTRFSRLGESLTKLGGNYRKFKQLLGEVLGEIGGIYYKFGKNSEQIGGEFRALH
jgi:hypothetical protein